MTTIQLELKEKGNIFLEDLKDFKGFIEEIMIVNKITNLAEIKKLITDEFLKPDENGRINEVFRNNLQDLSDIMDKAYHELVKDDVTKIGGKALVESELIPYRKKDKWGFCTPDKKIVVDCVYDYAEQFLKEKSRVLKNGNYLIINKQAIINTDFETTTKLEDKELGFSENVRRKLQVYWVEFHSGIRKNENIHVLKKDDKFGFIDNEGNEIISFKYDFATEFYKGLAMVKIDEKWGYINIFGTQYWED